MGEEKRERGGGAGGEVVAVAVDKPLSAGLLLTNELGNGALASAVTGEIRCCKITLKPGSSPDRQIQIVPILLSVSLSEPNHTAERRHAGEVTSEAVPYHSVIYFVTEASFQSVGLYYRLMEMKHPDSGKKYKNI